MYGLYESFRGYILCEEAREGLKQEALASWVKNSQHDLTISSQINYYQFVGTDLKAHCLSTWDSGRLSAKLLREFHYHKET